ncbi:MAG: cation:proton antiporter [Chloroflexi bacterium]|nr:cation:proton antiporter [Chloroflexota bacterium]
MQIERSRQVVDGVGWLILGDLNFWALGLLAVILAPTDAALGQAVVENPRVPARIRQALNVESGLNDGLAVPLVALFTAGAASAASASGGYDFWVELAARAIGYGLVVGLVGGLIVSYALNMASRAGWTNDSFRRIAMLGVPLCVYTVSESIGGSGFLSAFVAGLAVASITDTSRHGLLDFTDETGVLLGLITWVLFGGAFVGQTLMDISWEPAVYALLSLTVVRMVPVSISLLFSGFRWQTYAFLGWFGPRGLASIVFAIGVLEMEQIEDAQLIGETIVWTVALSVILHGATSGFGSQRYGVACERMPWAEILAGMPEMEAVPEMPTRRAFHAGHSQPVADSASAEG